MSKSTRIQLKKVKRKQLMPKKVVWGSLKRCKCDYATVKTYSVDVDAVVSAVHCPLLIAIFTGAFLPTTTTAKNLTPLNLFAVVAVSHTFKPSS